MVRSRSAVELTELTELTADDWNLGTHRLNLTAETEFCPINSGLSSLLSTAGADATRCAAHWTDERSVGGAGAGGRQARAAPDRRKATNRPGATDRRRAPDRRGP